MPELPEASFHSAPSDLWFHTTAANANATLGRVALNFNCNDPSTMRCNIKSPGQFGLSGIEDSTSASALSKAMGI